MSAPRIALCATAYALFIIAGDTIVIAAIRLIAAGARP